MLPKLCEPKTDVELLPLMGADDPNVPKLPLDGAGVEPALPNRFPVDRMIETRSPMITGSYLDRDGREHQMEHWDHTFNDTPVSLS